MAWCLQRDGAADSMRTITHPNVDDQRQVRLMEYIPPFRRRHRTLKLHSQGVDMLADPHRNTLRLDVADRRAVLLAETLSSCGPNARDGGFLLCLPLESVSPVSLRSPRRSRTLLYWSQYSPVRVQLLRRRCRRVTAAEHSAPQRARHPQILSDESGKAKRVRENPILSGDPCSDGSRSRTRKETIRVAFIYRKECMLSNPQRECVCGQARYTRLFAG